MNRDLGTKISDEINSESNIKGCIKGAVSDFIGTFDQNEEKLRAGFRKNREHLLWQAQGHDLELNKRVEKIQGCCETIKTEIRSIYLRERPPAPKPEPEKEKQQEPDYLLRDLRNFGTELKQGESNFRTITNERIAELGLMRPP